MEVARNAGFEAGGSPACSILFQAARPLIRQILEDGVCEFRVFTNHYDGE
jgi:hypothetical protein